MGKAELLQELDSAFSDLTQTVSGIDDGKGSETWYGQWNVRQVLGHITGWEHEMREAMETLGRGERPKRYEDIDDWNKRLSGQYTAGSMAEAVQSLEQAHNGFRQAAEALDESKFEEGRTAARILEGPTAGHYREHAEQIREWLKTGQSR